MPRLPKLDPSDLPPENRALLEHLPDLNVFKAMAGAGAVFPAFMQLANAYLNDGILDPRLRELVILRVGHLSGSTYEVHHHERVARNAGVSDEQIAAVASEIQSPHFDAREQAALRFTDDVVHHVKANDDAYEALASHLSPQEMLEVTSMIGFYMLVCRMLETFEIEIESGPPPEGDLEMIKRGAASVQDK